MENKAVFPLSLPRLSFLKMPRVGMWLVTRAVWGRGGAGCYFKDKQLWGSTVVRRKISGMWTRCENKLCFVKVSCWQLDLLYCLHFFFFFLSKVQNDITAEKPAAVVFRCLVRPPTHTRAVLIVTSGDKNPDDSSRSTWRGFERFRHKLFQGA